MSTSLTIDMKEIIGIKNKINTQAVKRFKDTHFKVSSRLRNKIVRDFLNFPGPPAPTVPGGLRVITGALRNETREIKPVLEGTTVKSGVAFGRGASRAYAVVHIGPRGKVSRSGQRTRVHPDEILRDNSQQITAEFEKTIEEILRT